MRADFRVGEWIVRPRRDCIERGSRIVHVKPKSMAVLERLARGAGQVVTRDELFDAVWPGGVVTDDVLTQCVVELRKALGDSARKPRFIQTVPKVGFRLLQSATPLGTADEPAVNAAAEGSAAALLVGWNPAARVFFFIAGTVLMGLVLFWYLSGSRDIPRPAMTEAAMSLAVLPFVDISEEQDQEWYAYGLTEELTNRLAQLQGLQVTGRTSAYRFKDRNEDLRQIGGALGVTHLLEGSVRTDADRLRITAQLIETQTWFSCLVEAVRSAARGHFRGPGGNRGGSSLRAEHRIAGGGPGLPARRHGQRGGLRTSHAVEKVPVGSHARFHAARRSTA